MSGNERKISKGPAAVIGKVQAASVSQPTQRASVVTRNWSGPRTITVPRDHDGYGFTLRYFVVYPPPSVYKGDDDDDDEQESYWSDFETNDEEVSEKRSEPLDTFFVKNVAPAGAADAAGLCEGDRIVSINGNLIGGKSYKDVVDLIQNCIIAGLHHLPKRDDGSSMLKYNFTIDPLTGDLKIGVVPRDEDILQLAYQEYVYDGASLGYTAGLEQLAQDFDMQQPSINKWATPIHGSSRKTSVEENFIETVKPKVSKYDPCVSFSAGAPILRQDVRYSLTVKPCHGNSSSSSGKSTPGARMSGGSTPPYKVTKRIDPCVTFVAGKPVLTPPSEDDEAGRKELSRGGVNPVTLNNALRQKFPEETKSDENASRKGRVIIKQHFDREALQVAIPGVVERIKTNYSANDNSKKSSAISVLRDDFRVPVSKSETRAVQDNVQITVTSNDPAFQLSVSLAESDSSLTQTAVTYSRDLIARGQRARVGGNLTSLTSQATLVESKTSPNAFDRNQVARRGIRTHSSSQRDNMSRRGLKEEEEKKSNNKIGFVVASRNGGYPAQKISSSSDLSDDDSAIEYSKDVDGVSADEVENYSIKGNRRVSYLMATATSPTVTLPHKLSDISNTEADDEDSDNLSASQTLQRHYSQESVGTEADDMKGLPIVKEGWLNKKLVHSSDGRRRASSRTWKSLYTVLQGHYLYCYKDKIDHEGSSYDEEQMQIINVKGSVVDIAHDYAKRKHVLRLTTASGSEYLFQAPDTQSLMAWVNALRDSNPEKDSNGNCYENVIVRRMKSYEGEVNSGTSPPGTTKANNIKKGLSLKKTHFTLGYSKTKKRGLVNIHISHPKDKEIQATGFTFGLPLEKCPPGKENEFVPVLIEHCCRVVEAKGLDYLGIYRVPGNAAAVQLLQEELDTKEPDSINFEEEKWNDLNNIGSLLKSFLRKLPEPLIPKDMYTKFIEANREEDSNDRLKALRYLIRHLPDYHSQTLRFLINHLRLIADHSDKNKMEPKNLAIVFGPTVVRTSDENMVSMVKDMSDQCRIIETFIHQADWIYAEDDSMECVTEEPVKTETDGGRCYVASKGLLESLGQMAENFDGTQGDQQTKQTTKEPNNPKEIKEPNPKDPKDKQSVASAIMSLTNFTTGISFKLRNKAMSPVFSKKMGKQEANTSSESDNIPSGRSNDGNNPPQLRRLASDPQILSRDNESSRKPNYVSEGENDDSRMHVKSKIKSKYSRAVPLSSNGTTVSSRTYPKQVKTDTLASSPEDESPKPGNNRNGTNFTINIPLRAEVTVRDDSKKDQGDAYKAALLSEKTRLRLQQVSSEHQAAIEKRQVEREKIEREREKTLRDLRQEEEDIIAEEGFIVASRDSDDTISSTSGSNSSSRKESLDSLSSPLTQRRYELSARRVTSRGSVSSDDKSPVYALTQAEIDQREREKRQLDVFLGQFETSDDDSKPMPVMETIPPQRLSPSRNVTTVENLGAKSLDEKLRILLDPNFQEKDGKLVRRNHSGSSSNSSLSPTDGKGRNFGLGYGLSEKKADFAASYRGIDRPLKTKVIGLSATKLSNPLYSPDMAARFDNFRQKKQELEKKVSTILQDSSKTKSIYDNECNKTDEQKVASLRQRAQIPPPLRVTTPITNAMQRVTSPTQRVTSPTQRVIVSASDLSKSPQRAVPNIVPEFTFEKTSRIDTESSLQRLDRNFQQVVELLQDSHMSELKGENSELAALLNSLQRQASSGTEITNRSKRHAPLKSDGDDGSAKIHAKTKRGDINTIPMTAGRHDNPRADLVRVQQWRTGQSLSEQPKVEYGKFYPR